MRGTTPEFAGGNRVKLQGVATEIQPSQFSNNFVSFGQYVQSFWLPRIVIQGHNHVAGQGLIRHFVASIMQNN